MAPMPLGPVTCIASIDSILGESGGADAPAPDQASSTGSVAGLMVRSAWFAEGCVE